MGWADVCVCVSYGEKKKDHRSRVVYTVASRFPLRLSKTLSQRNMTDINTRTWILACVCCACDTTTVPSCQPTNLSFFQCFKATVYKVTQVLAQQHLQVC